jgi:DNA-directed RNA polymerase subunit N (RpoN/RPB10)
MLYIVCPTCRRLLGNRQLIYEAKLDEICKKVEMNKITTDEADKQKKELVNSLGLSRYCCKMRLMSYRKLISFVK